MIAKTFFGEGKQCGREEHGFIIRMGNQKTDTFILELGDGDAGDVCCIQPGCCQKDGSGECKVEEHVDGTNW